MHRRAPDRRAVLAGLVGAVAGLLGAAAHPATVAAAPAPGPLPAGAGGRTGPAFLVGEPAMYRVGAGDTLPGIARRFGLGYTELVAANRGVDVWLPPEGTTLTLPTAHIVPAGARRGLLINLAQQRLFRFDDSGALAATHAVGVGRQGWETRTGITRIVRKRPDPVWIPPDSIRAERPGLPRAVPPGPNNPLGRFALDLGWPRYVIHGTNRPYGIGRRVSHGCVRLYPEDIAKLFAAAALDMPVEVVDRPLLACRRDGVIYLESHPAPAQADALAAGGDPPADVPADLAHVLVAAADGAAAGTIDWPHAMATAAAYRGVPVAVGRY